MHVVKAENHSEVTKKDSVYLLPVDATGEKTEAAVYVPGYKWKSLDATNDNAYIYFALENYSFFQTATDIIEQDKERKGVFRFRSEERRVGKGGDIGGGRVSNKKV